MGVEKRLTLVNKKKHQMKGKRDIPQFKYRFLRTTELYFINVTLLCKCLSGRNVVSFSLSRAIMIFPKYGMDFVQYGCRFSRNSGTERGTDLLCLRDL